MLWNSKLLHFDPYIRYWWAVFAASVPCPGSTWTIYTVAGSNGSLHERDAFFIVYSLQIDREIFLGLQK